MNLRRLTAASVQPSARLGAFVPNASFRDTVIMRSGASSTRLMKALFEVTLHDMPIAWLLGALRYLPSRLSSDPSPHEIDPNRSFLNQLTSGKGTLVLERTADEIILGVVGKLHQIRDQEMVVLQTPAQFIEFNTPDHEKLAISLRVVPEGQATCLVLEHRTEPTDTDAWYRFRRYWRAIRPTGAFVSRQFLRAAAQRAEEQIASGNVWKWG